MTVALLLLTVGSSLGWAGYDALRKTLADRYVSLVLAGLFALGQVPVFAIWLLAAGDLHVGAAYWLPGLAVLGCNGLANVFFFRALQLSPFTVVVPLLSLTPAFTAVFGVVVLGEYLDPWQSIGVGLVVGGALLVQAPSFRDLPATLRGFGRAPGALMMIGVAACWGVTGVCDKICLAETSVAMHVVVQSTGLGVPVLGFVLLRGRGREIVAVRHHALHYAAAIGLAALSLTAQLVAIQVVFVGIFEATKRAIGNLASIVSGRLFFGEGVRLTRLVAVLVMSLGVWLLAR